MKPARTYDLMDDEHRGWKEPDAVLGFHARAERDDNFTRACIVAILALAIGAGTALIAMPDREQITMEMMP